MSLLAAVFWGISGTCAQYLFEQKQLQPDWLVCWRMILSGIILLGFSFIKREKDFISIWKKPKDTLQLIFFGMIVMASVQFTYFYSISLSNAATATVLQYLGPVLVVGFYALKDRRWPIALEYISLFLALSGTFMLVTHGSLDTLIISDKALFWGFLSALAVALYTIFPVGLLRTYSAASVTGWGMLLGGLAMTPFVEPWEMQGNWDMEAILAFSYIILFGSVLAFYFFLRSISIIGATNASLICSIEPLSAAITAVVWLGIQFEILDWLGTLFVLATVIILSLGSKEKKAVSTGA